MRIISTLAPTPKSRDTVARSLASWRFVVACLLMMVLLLAQITWSSGARTAYAQDGSDAAQPSVLLVDSSLGDLTAFRLHWLGEDAQEIAVNGSVSLVTTLRPLWWSEGSAPSTFLLGNSAQGPMTATDIVWALDEIAKTNAEPKTLIVASGASGLQARLYAEDLADVKQSARADLVGMVFLGTPHQGYSIAQDYPKLTLWSTLASAAGFAGQDVLPQSSLLTELNAAPFPNIVKSLQVSGSIGDMGFGATDGAAVQADMAFPNTVSTQVQAVSSRATVSQQVGLTAFWMPYSKNGGQNAQVVDSDIAERISAMESYVTSAEIQAQTKEFYQAWFADGAPVTHVSTVLTLDISGSMREIIDNETRLEVAKQAAGDFMQVIDIRSEKSYAVPTDVTVLAFNTEVSTIATGYDVDAIAALQNLNARAETNIGIAMQASLDALEHAPTSADKHIIFLSDGASTEGESNEQILAGSVTAAKDAGIAIDTIAFGDMGESDVDFLRQISASTGGVFYEARDTYGLRVSFLKAYYTSLGLNLFDAEVDPSSTVATSLGQVGANTRSLEIGFIADGETPAFTLTRDGEVLDVDTYTVLKDNDGLVTLQIEYPASGEYSLNLNGYEKRVHVFAVGQLTLFQNALVVAQAQDNSIYFLIGAAAILVLLILILVITTLVKKKKATPSSEFETKSTSQGSVAEGHEQGIDSPADGGTR